MKHKVINLKKDKVFQHSISYNDNLDYAAKMIKLPKEKDINEEEREIQSK